MKVNKTVKSSQSNTIKNRVLKIDSSKVSKILQKQGEYSEITKANRVQSESKSSGPTLIEESRKLWNDLRVQFEIESKIFERKVKSTDKKLNNTFNKVITFNN